MIGATPRMLDAAGRAQVGLDYPASAIALPTGADPLERDDEAAIKQHTADSFSYEWHHFGAPREQWRKNFLDYMQPHGAEFFDDLLLLDVGSGSGRHSAQAAALGARVVAIDLGRSIDVARRNVPADVLTVQADAEHLPFAPETFDFVMSIGVLHHLPDPSRALKSLIRYAAPGGSVHVYLYWTPERRWHRFVLRLVTAARRVTVRMPHKVLHRLCYPLAAVLWMGVVLPYRSMRGHPLLARFAEALPLKTYADYPFAVLVNDQFDRFSAPLENRYTRVEVDRMMRQAGLTDVTVRANHGWIGEGRVPSTELQNELVQDRRLSVLVTVRDDAQGLRELLPALLAQTRRPDELVIVDGGSSDGTLEVLDEFDFGDLDVRTEVVAGANIAAGRNMAVELAQYERIAFTDAGCRPDPEWLAALDEALNHADIVGGVFIPEPRTLFEHALAVTHYPDADELDHPTPGVRLALRLFGRRYLPYRAGCRSIAFWRSTWQAAGGFPELQYAGEDHAFVRTAEDIGCSADHARDAVVRWRPPGDWEGNARMFFHYCRGDVRSKGRSRHLLRAAAWTLAPTYLLKGSAVQRAAIVGGGLGYMALPLRRARRDRMPFRGVAMIPAAIAVKDLAQLAGAACGAVDALRGRPQPTPDSQGDRSRRRDRVDQR